MMVTPNPWETLGTHMVASPALSWAIEVLYSEDISKFSVPRLGRSNFW